MVDHAAFASLNVLRPDHYVRCGLAASPATAGPAAFAGPRSAHYAHGARLVWRVYAAFIEGEGKIKSKEL